MLDRTNDALATTEIVLQAGDLGDALRRVRHAICKEETRYYLGGVYVHYVPPDNVLRFVATMATGLPWQTSPHRRAPRGFAP